MDQTVSLCCHAFMIVTESYHSKVTPIGELHAEEIVETVLLYVSKLDGVGPVDNRPSAD